MISRKKCSEEGCDYPVWARGKCRMHDKGKPKSKPKKAISPISDKEKERLKEYRVLRDKFLFDNPYCKICGGMATDLHHMKGRVGDNLTDVDNFLALCRFCHNRVEENPKWSKENGYSKNRL